MGYSSKKEWATIANIIDSEDFDIVALQEVLSEGKALRQNILPKLGREWEMKWGTPNKVATQDTDENNIGDKRGEGYAFLWRADRFRKVRTILNTEEIRIAEPHILNSLTDEIRDIDINEFFRAPYYARFIPCSIGSNPHIEIRLINAHLFYGSANSSDVYRRKREFDILIKQILPELADKRYGNFRPAYTIILGDYNFNLDRPWNRYPQSPILDKTDEIIELREGHRIKRLRTTQEGMTTLKKVTDPYAENKGREYKKSYHFKNNYDHFSYDEEYFKEHGIKVKCQKVDAIRKYCNNDFDKYQAFVSDHLPVVFEMDF